MNITKVKDNLKNPVPIVFEVPKITPHGKSIEELDKLIIKKPILPEITETEFIDMSVKLNRDRYTQFPDRLPTNGLLPLPVDEHKHIGNYESLHTLYLTIANAYNKLMERVEQLEKKVK
jgi:hypothetical protein